MIWHTGPLSVHHSVRRHRLQSEHAGSQRQVRSGVHRPRQLQRIHFSTRTGINKFWYMYIYMYNLWIELLSLIHSGQVQIRSGRWPPTSCSTAGWVCQWVTRVCGWRWPVRATRLTTHNSLWLMRWLIGWEGVRRIFWSKKSVPHYVIIIIAYIIHILQWHMFYMTLFILLT